jgi:hypothetical protein
LLVGGLKWAQEGCSKLGVQTASEKETMNETENECPNTDTSPSQEGAARLWLCRRDSTGVHGTCSMLKCSLMPQAMLRAPLLEFSHSQFIRQKGK